MLALSSVTHSMSRMCFSRRNKSRDLPISSVSRSVSRKQMLMQRLLTISWQHSKPKTLIIFQRRLQVTSVIFLHRLVLELRMCQLLLIKASWISHRLKLPRPARLLEVWVEPSSVLMMKKTYQIGKSAPELSKENNQKLRERLVRELVAP